MAEENQSFANTRSRLEEIVSQVRKKDTSLEKSLDLLEEGVRLANQCTELIDHADWEFAEPGNEAAADSDVLDADTAPSGSEGDTAEVDEIGQPEGEGDADDARKAAESDDEDA